LAARHVWETWKFHDFQPAETFDNGIQLGFSLQEFISNSQAYQARLIQYATECYRLAKNEHVTGIVQFDLTDPWPAVTWSVLDYWRTPKPGYDALLRSMQPVLPSFQFPDRIKPHHSVPISFQVVNDLEDHFPNAICEWNISNETGILSSADFLVDIPADGVSERVNLILPSMDPGSYKISALLKSNDIILGENLYEIDTSKKSSKSEIQ
jgi:beta-mannosidase